MRDFYTRAANDDYQAAWALLSPQGQALFGSYGRFRGTFRTLEGITLTRAQAASTSGSTSSVAIATVATHTNRIDRCTGTVRTVRGGAGWLIDGLSVGCSSSPRSGEEGDGE